MVKKKIGVSCLLILFVFEMFGVEGSLRAPRPPVDTGSASSTGPVGDTFEPTAGGGGFTLPDDVNIVHNLTVGNDLTVDGVIYARGGIGDANSTTTFAGLVNAAAAHLVLPVAATAPVTDLVDGAVVDVGGFLYMYDATRAAWLSIDHPLVWFARSGSSTNTYLNILDGISSRSTGYLVTRDATITGISVNSGGNIWYVASVGGDFPDLQTALASPSVVNGDTIKMAAETFTTLTQITISKSVRIEGCGAGPVIRTAGTTDDPTHVLYITVGNVALVNLDVEQRKTVNTSVESAINVQAPGATGIEISGTTSVTTMEFGIVMHAAQFAIENCDFHYQGAAGNNHRFIAVYGNGGNSRIVDNDFVASSDAPTARTIFCLLTAGVGDTYAGSLIMSNNTQTGGNLRQFFLQESFTGAAGGFGLYFANNTYNDANGGIIFYDSANLLNLFSSIVLTNNTVSNGAGKGLVGFDGYDVGVLPGTTNWYINGNTIANPTISQPGWASACAIPGAVGYNTAVFAPFTITYSSVIPTPPSRPATFAIEVRKNGCPAAVLTATLYALYGWANGINVPVDSGDRLQTYVAGTAINPTVGLEYAYRI